MSDEALRLKLLLQQQQSSAPAPQRNPDGTYGQVPEGWFLDPTIGAYTSRDGIKANMSTSRGGAAARGAGAGLTFNLDDEAQALGAYLRGGEDLGRFRLEQARAQQELDEEAHPYASMGGQVAGAMAPAALSAPLAMGRGIAGTMGRGAVLGAIEGAAHGAGSGEGLEGRAKEAGMGAAVGGTVGAAAPGVIAAGKKVANPLISAVTRQPSQSRVSRGLLETLRQSGRTVDDVADDVKNAALEGQGEFRLMDALGNAGQRRASGLTRAGGDGATEIAEYLEKRQLGQPERISGFVDDAFGMGGDTAKARAAALTEARNTTANAAYDAARGNSAPVDVRGALSVIDARTGGMTGSGVAGDGIDAKLMRYRSRLAADVKATPKKTNSVAAPITDFNRVLGVKQAVQDDIGAAVRAGRNNEARELGKLVAALDEALEGASDGYRAANDGFREASRVIDAVGEGASMSRPGQRAADTTARFNAMTPEQQAAARVGYGDSLLSRLEANSSPTANRAKPMQSPKVETERAAMALDPDLLARRLERENAMWSVQNRALGGSRTADNQADIEATSGVVGGLVDAMRMAANFNPGDAAKRATEAIGPAMRGENEATRVALARALLSADPKSVLEPAVRKQMEMGLQDGLIAAMMRQPGREASPF